MPDESVAVVIDVVSVRWNERSAIVPDCVVEDESIDSVVSAKTPVMLFPLPERSLDDVEVVLPVIDRSLLVSERSCVEVDPIVAVTVNSPVISFPICVVDSV